MHKLIIMIIEMFRKERKIEIQEEEKKTEFLDENHKTKENNKIAKRNRRKRGYRNYYNRILKQDIHEFRKVKYGNFLTNQNRRKLNENN